MINYKEIKQLPPFPRLDSGVLIPGQRQQGIARSMTLSQLAAHLGLVEQPPIAMPEIRVSSSDGSISDATASPDSDGVVALDLRTLNGVSGIEIDSEDGSVSGRAERYGNEWFLNLTAKQTGLGGIKEVSAQGTIDYSVPIWTVPQQQISSLNLNANADSGTKGRFYAIVNRQSYSLPVYFGSGQLPQTAIKPYSTFVFLLMDNSNGADIVFIDLGADDVSQWRDGTVAQSSPSNFSAFSAGVRYNQSTKTAVLTGWFVTAPSTSLNAPFSVISPLPSKANYFLLGPYSDCASVVPATLNENGQVTIDNGRTLVAGALYYFSVSYDVGG